MKISKTQALVESAIMIAIATLLSFIKLVDLPYGGSVTIASMLPIIIIAYRHGVGTGLMAGLVYGIIQQLLGLNTLSYVTTWQSILAVILLDYIVAFLVLGLGGIFRNRFNSQAPALTLGAAFVCILRYACHVISGATVWAGLSIPTKGALIYSFAYNATYMLPETIVLIIVTYYIGSLLDFRTAQPVRLSKSDKGDFSILQLLAGLILTGGVVADVALVFSKLQNADTGEWNIAGLADVKWMIVAIVTAAAVIISAVLFFIGRKNAKTEKITQE